MRLALLAALLLCAAAAAAASSSTCQVSFNSFFAVVEAPDRGLLVAVGTCSFASGGQIVYVSSDAGQSWTRAPAWTSPGLSTFTSVAYSPDHGLFVAVGANCTVATSADGLAWSVEPVTSENFYFQVVRYLGGEFIVMGDVGTAFMSSDGVAWKRLPGVRAALPMIVDGVAASSQLVVAVGAQGNNGSIIFSSDSALQRWDAAQQPATPGFRTFFRDVFFCAERALFVAVGSLMTPMRQQFATVYTSHDGVSWQLAFNASSSDTVLTSVVYVPWAHDWQGMLLAVGNVIVTSPDGVAWTPAPTSGLPSPLTSFSYLNDVLVLSANQTVLAVGRGNRVWRSSDGFAWQQSGPRT